jgi:hypothetical protein
MVTNNVQYLFFNLAKIAASGRLGQVGGDQIGELRLDRAVGTVRGRHGLGFAVNELPKLFAWWVPGEELGDGHPDRDFR